LSVADETVRIEVSRVEGGLRTLLLPEAEAWDRAKPVVVRVEPTPLDRLPSAYVRTAWEERPRGTVREVRVRALANGDAFAVRLDWAALRPSRLISDVNVYPDGCAVVFPADGVAADFATMGSPEQPVRAWHWRAGTDEPFVVTATGIGTTERASEHPVRVQATWTEGRWHVVLAGPVAAEGVPLRGRFVLPVAFAVWSGAARERAGLKSISPQPCELRLGQG
jgi:DMSO reductase family type II enzyme heme b subunit